MSKNSRLLVSRYSLSIRVNGLNCRDDIDLIRIYEGDRLEILLSLDSAEDFSAVYLHTDMYSDHWEMLPFEKDGQSWIYRIESRRGGRASFRFAAKKGGELFWEPDNYRKLLIDPAVMKSIRMYTLIPNATGGISDWAEQLPAIAEMGFNTLHILPFTAMCPSESPYAAEDLFRIDKAYGKNISEFKDFAKKAAESGIIICLDIVLNHIGFTNEICRRHADWIVPDRGRADGMKRAGCYHHDSWISWEDLVLINYEHPDLSARYRIYDYMLEYVLFWIDAAGGENVMIRLDNLHSSNEHFIRWLIPVIRKKYPGMIILSELFGADNYIDEAVKKFGLNLITANSWEYPFAPDLQRYIAYTHGQSGAARYYMSPVSHDTGTAAEMFGTPDSAVPRYAVCALMGTGAAGTVQGFETGIAEKINFIGRSINALPDTGLDYRHFIGDVNRLLETEPCLTQKGNIEFYDTGNDSLIVCRRRGAKHGMLIAVNLDIYNGHSFDYPLIGPFEEAVCERAGIFHEGYEDRIHIKLEACGVCAVRIGR